MLIEAGKDFNLLKGKVTEIGSKTQACAWICEALESGDLKPEECSIRDLYEALDTTTFPKAVGALINKKVIDSYNLAPSIWRDLVTVVPSNKKSETIVGFDAVETPDSVNEGMPYRDSTMGEKYVTIENQKYGRLISITEETVMFDQTGQILMRCRDIGEKAALFQEKLIVEGVIDKNSNVYRPTGVATPLYSSNHTNLGSTAFGEAGLEALRLLIHDMTDENGDYVLIDERAMILLIPMELDLEAYQLLRSTLTPESAENAINRYRGMYQVKTSPFLTVATSYWLGDFKRDFVWQEVYPLQMLQREMKDTDEGFKRDIIAQFKTRFYGGIGAIDFRHVFKGNT